MSDKKTLSIDFDGVIHSYISGWQGAVNIPDPPVPGALAWMARAQTIFRLVISSTRAAEEEARKAMRQWLQAHEDERMEHVRAQVHRLDVAAIEITDRKVPCIVHLDDRAVRFEGTFPDPESLARSTPWNRRPAESAETGATEEERGILSLLRTYRQHDGYASMLDAIEFDLLQALRRYRDSGDGISLTIVGGPEEVPGGRKYVVERVSGRVVARVVIPGDPDSPYSLPPRNDIWNHSPTGFEYGYGGSGPAQLALAILADATGDDEVASVNHQRFKSDTVASWPQNNNRPHVITRGEVLDWLGQRGKQPSFIEVTAGGELRKVRVGAADQLGILEGSTIDMDALTLLRSWRPPGSSVGK